MMEITNASEFWDFSFYLHFEYYNKNMKYILHACS